MFKQIALVILLFSQQFYAMADQAPSQPEDAPTSVPRDIWAASLNKKIPQQLCQADSQFLTCFEVEAVECMSMVSWFSESCLQNMHTTLPSNISPQDGKLFGERLGRCVYDLYNMFLKDKKTTSEACPEYQAPKGFTATPKALEKPTLSDPTQPRTQP